MTSNNSMLTAALDYTQRRHWEIFPVPPGTKMGYSIKQRGHDNGRQWGKTTDEAEVRKYWRRLPRANIGLVMGVGSGIFDIEVDTVEGHPDLEQDGATSLAALERRHGKLPATLMFESPSGSVHRLFKHPGGDFRVKDPKEKLGIGIDVRGDGNMSVAPPSRTSKGVYRWVNNRRIAKPPQWLLDLVCRPAPAPRTAVSDEELPSRETVIMVLALLPNDNPNPNWDFWKDIGLRIYASTGGSGDDLFHAWSHKHRSYNAAYTSRAWKNEIATCPPDRYGPRAIINLIDEMIPEWRTAVMNSAYDAQIKKFFKLLDESK